MKTKILLFFLLITSVCYSQIQPLDHTAPDADNLKEAAIKINANDLYLEGLANDAVDRIDSLIVTIPDYDSIGLYPLATASGTDTYTATVTPAFSAYASGQKFNIKFTNANTGAATINLNGLGAKTIVKNGSAALSAGDISAGQILFLQYDGTNMQVIGNSNYWKTSGTTTLAGNTTIAGSSGIGIGAPAEGGSKFLIQGTGTGSNYILNLRNSLNTPVHVFRENGNATIGNFTFSTTGNSISNNSSYQISGPSISLLSYSGSMAFQAFGGPLVFSSDNGMILDIGSDATGDIYQRDDLGKFSRLASVATGNALISGGVGAVNSWGKIGLDTHVSGILPIANGGTGSSSAIVADAINDGTTTVAPSQNAVFDGLALKVDKTTTIAGVALVDNVTGTELRTALAQISDVVCWSYVSTYTNAPNSEFWGAALTHPIMFDASAYQFVRISVYVRIASTSVNSPRLYPQYSTDNGSSWITIGAGTIASGDAISLEPPGSINKITNWIALPAGAKADVIFRIAQNGGDGINDPQLTAGRLQFKN